MVDPHSPYFSSNFNDSVTSPLIEEESLKEREPLQPSFPPPIKKKEKPKAIIPGYLLRDAQKVRDQQETRESLIPNPSVRLSEELRAKRKQTYFPDNSKKEDS
jgi:hypothetical protein